MAEWEHKERTFMGDERYESKEGLGKMIVRGRSKSWRKRDFTSWLDWQCEGGWEVFKISRDFNGGSGTWCIFRRLV